MFCRNALGPVCPSLVGLRMLRDPGDTSFFLPQGSTGVACGSRWGRVGQAGHFVDGAMRCDNM